MLQSTSTGSRNSSYPLSYTNGIFILLILGVWTVPFLYLTQTGYIHTVHSLSTSAFKHDMTVQRNVKRDMKVRRRIDPSTVYASYIYSYIWGFPSANWFPGFFVQRTENKSWKFSVYSTEIYNLFSHYIDCWKSFHYKLKMSYKNFQLFIYIQNANICDILTTIKKILKFAVVKGQCQQLHRNQTN